MMAEKTTTMANSGLKVLVPGKGRPRKGFSAGLLVLAFVFAPASGSQTAQPPASPATQPSQSQTPAAPASTGAAMPASPAGAQVQTASPPAAPPANPNPPETVTKDEPATFKARVNLVMVPVIVLDKQGKTVGGLHQEDFQLFDKSKPQTITK